jgi:hypothetical protein
MRDDLDRSTADPEAPAERAPATAARRRAERASAELLRRLDIHPSRACADRHCRGE